MNEVNKSADTASESLEPRTENLITYGGEESGNDNYKAGGFYLIPHLTYILSAVVTVSFIIWASTSTLDIVSMATGEVVPSSQVKTVQHLEGGIVSEILVREGELVKQGQKLVVLAPTASSADVKELEVRLAGLEIEIARHESLLALKKGQIYSEEIKKKYPRRVKQSIQRANIQRRRHESELSKQQKTILQRQQVSAEIKIRIQNNQAGLKLIREQVAISGKLLKEQLVNRYEHLDLLKEEGRLNGSIKEDRAALDGAKAALGQARASLTEIQDIFDDDNRKKLDQARQTFTELSQRMGKFKDSLYRTILRAPVGGIVKTLYVATIGGVVKSGEPVLDLVPEDDKLIIEAKLATADVGYVQNGQGVVVKLASADAARFNGLVGKVVSISPDTLMTPEGSPFYKVRVQTNKSYFEKGASRYNLLPGMQVIANIQIGERTVVEYFLQPFIGSISDAMQER
jgi:adhesin transport system membrane fusion protein